MRRQDITAVIRLLLYSGWGRINKENAAEKEERPLAGSLVKAKWFLEKADNWKEKRLAMFCVGGSPNDNPDVEIFIQNALTEDQKKYIKMFYCQGGFNYENLKNKRGNFFEVLCLVYRSLSQYYCRRESIRTVPFDTAL